MTDQETLERVRDLCAGAALPVTAKELILLADAYTLVAEGVESLQDFEDYDASVIFTFIDPARDAEQDL